MTDDEQEEIEYLIQNWRRIRQELTTVLSSLVALQARVDDTALDARSAHPTHQRMQDCLETATDSLIEALEACIAIRRRLQHEIEAAASSDERLLSSEVF